MVTYSFPKFLLNCSLPPEAEAFRLFTSNLLKRVPLEIDTRYSPISSGLSGLA